MSDMAEDQVPSPCIRLCTLNEYDICLGCGRSVEEICAWRNMNDDERRATLGRAALRRELSQPVGLEP